MDRVVLFEAKSALGKIVRLGEAQWVHIEARHQEMHGQLDKMKLTLTEPEVIYCSPSEETFHYYREFMKTPVSRKHLLLVAKHQDGEGFIITAFFVAKIRRKEKALVYGSKNRDLV